MVRKSREREYECWSWLAEPFPENLCGGIDRNCNESRLKEVFSPFSVVVDIFIPKRQGIMKNFAFVRFRRQADSERSLRMNPVIWIGGHVVR